MEKIEFINVNGNDLPLSFFPPEVKAQVTTFEIVRSEYNKSVVNTTALSNYMQQLSQQIQSMADQHVEQVTAKKAPVEVLPAEDKADVAE